MFFKERDKVKLIDENNIHYGKIGRVYDICSSIEWPITVRFKDVYCLCTEYDLKLIERKS